MTQEVFRSTHDAELRQQRIDTLIAEEGSNWAESQQPGTFGCHELLDRTALVMDIAERSLLEHPACIANEEWYRLAEQAVDALNELYQRVGKEHLTADGEA
jgi:hypothetical protein